MTSPRVDAATIAMGVADLAVSQAATDADNEDVKRHLIELAEILRSRPAFHVIDFAEHGWTIMHPLVGCGLYLFECPVNEAAGRGVPRPDRYARFRCDVDSDGRLVVGQEVSGE